MSGFPGPVFVRPHRYFPERNFYWNRGKRNEKRTFRLASELLAYQMEFFSVFLIYLNVQTRAAPLAALLAK